MGPLLCRRPPFVGAAVLVLSAALLVTAGLARAQTPPSPGSARGLTQSLVALDAQYRGAGAAGRAQLVSQLLNVAATRQQVLLSLVESDPGEVLRVALPANLRAGMASSVQQYLEKETALDGVLTVLHEDSPTGGRYRYFLESGGRRLSLHFATHPPTHLLTGSHIRVTGVQIGTMLALDGSTSLGSTSLQTVAPAPLPNSFGAQKTVVILVNFQDNPVQPYTLAYTNSVVFGTANDFIRENSYGQTWLTGNVVGWYTIPLNSTSGCDNPDITSYADSAATAAGVNLSAYTRYVYVIPHSCGGGSATVGGNPSRAYIFGSLGLNLVGHELGHNFGLVHSHSWMCTDGTTLCPSTGTLVEYGDGLDIMGSSPSGHYNAFQKERLGWLNAGISPPITTVTASGNYAIDVYEPTGTNPKALKILKNTNLTTGYQDWYYLEFRQAIGFDSVIASGCSYDGVTCNSGLNYNNILGGVLIHHNTFLVDMTPETWQFYTRDPALTDGRSFADPDAGVTITAGSNGTVSVALDAPACSTRSTPTVALSPSTSQAVPAGIAVTYTVSVTNNDGAPCAATSFSLQANVLSGWTAAFAAPMLTVNHGGSASTTLTVTSPVSTVDGTYGVAVGATNTNDANISYSGSNWAAYVIGAALNGSALNVSVSTNKPSYTGGQTVSVATRVSSGGSPVSNASVKFTMTKADGSVVIQTGTTDSTGSAAGNFKLKPKDPVGGYKASVYAVKTPASASATTSFTVK